VGDELYASTYEPWSRFSPVASNRKGQLATAWQDGWGDGVAANAFSCNAPLLEEPRAPLLHLPVRQEFNGVDDVVEIEDPALDINEYTIAFWFKADYPDQEIQSLIARGEDPADRAQWIVQLNAEENPGKVQLWYEEEDDRDHVFSGQTSIAADKWYHCAITRSAAGEVNVFLDGARELTVLDPAAPASIDAPVLIGARRNSPAVIQEFFDGQMEEVAIFAQVLSAYQVNALLSRTRPQEAEGGLIYSRSDEIELNGTDEFFTVDDSPELQSHQYSIAFSVLARSPDRGTQTLVARGADTDLDRIQWAVQLNHPGAQGKVRLMYQALDGSVHSFSGTTEIQQDLWYHVLITRSLEGVVRVYIDGLLEGEETDITTPARVISPVFVGALNDPGAGMVQHFEGIIQDLMIYNKPLNDREIRAVLPGTPPVITWLAPEADELVQNTQVPLRLTFDRPIASAFYHLDNPVDVSLMPKNYLYQEDADSLDVFIGRVTFGYNKPAGAFGAIWRFKYENNDGTFVEELAVPESCFSYSKQSISLRVNYNLNTETAVVQYFDGEWQDLKFLGNNNPGGNGNDGGVLTDGDWSSGACIHVATRAWMTTCGATFVKFYEEALLWDMPTTISEVDTTIDVPEGNHSLIVCAVDRIGNMSCMAREFSVAEPQRPRFLRGDANGDAAIDLPDAVRIIWYLFLGSEKPGCMDAADADDTGDLDLSDAMYLLGWLFTGANDAPPAPGPETAGPDPTEDELDCQEYPGI